MTSQVLSTSKTLSKGNITVNFDVNVTKKSTAATVEVLFTGSESILLSKLLWQFTVEKCLTGFENANTHIFNAIAGPNVIVFNCPDSKVLSSILVLYQFLLKYKINPQLLKDFNTKTDNYDKVYDIIKSFRVIVTGKCRATYNAVSTTSPKFNALGELLDGLYKKLRGKLSIKAVDQPNQLCTCTLELTKEPTNKALFGLYLSIALGDIACKATINGPKVDLTFYDEHCCWAPLSKSAFKGRVKGFLTQYGSIGSEPDARDAEKAAKYAVKSKTILESLTKASEITCQLHGQRPYKFENANDARTINSDLLTIIKGAKLQKLKEAQ